MISGETGLEASQVLQGNAAGPSLRGSVLEESQRPGLPVARVWGKWGTDTTATSKASGHLEPPRWLLTTQPREMREDLLKYLSGLSSESDGLVFPRQSAISYIECSPHTSLWLPARPGGRASTHISERTKGSPIPQNCSATFFSLFCSWPVSLLGWLWNL